MTVYFFDHSTKRYIGKRPLAASEGVPADATCVPVSISDGEQAFFNGESWSIEPIQEDTHPSAAEKTVEQRIEEMAEQLVLAQEALDFLIMGGM